MKNIKIFLLVSLIFTSLEIKFSKKSRKLEESDIVIYENTNKIYDSSDRAFPPEIEIVNGSSISPDIYINSHDILEEEVIFTSIENNPNIPEINSSSSENTNTKSSDELPPFNVPTNTPISDNKTTVVNNTENSDEVNPSNKPSHIPISDNKTTIVNNTENSHEVNPSNKPSHTQISEMVKSTIVENNTDINNIPNHNNPLYSSKLILLGFGHYYRPIIQKQFIFFIIYFFRVVGNIPSRSLRFPIILAYSTRLRLLEENYANCTRITDDYDPNIQYNCSVPVDPNKTISSLNLKEQNLIFGNGEAVNYVISSNANQTKSNIISQIGNDLDKGIIIINDTILKKDNEKFVLIGNSSEKFNDSKIILSLDNNGNIINVDCNSKNLKGKLYEFECIPKESINNHLNGVSGKTDSGQYLVINFQDEKDDLVDIKVNSTSIVNSDSFFEGGKISSSSSGLSDGVIVAIIIAGAILLIAIVILIACCCCKKGEVKPPFEESSVQQPFPKDTTNQSI